MAALELATGYISLVPSAKGFGTALRREVGDVGASVGDDIGHDASRRIQLHLGDAFAAIARAAVTAGAIIGAAGVGLGAWGLKSAADLQQTEIAFAGILGSATEANDFIGELRSFAAKTPFEFPELANSAKNLLAVGVNAKDVLPIMTTLGNVAATLGVGGPAIEGVVRALGQMKGKGKASAEELQQISEQIPGFSAIGAIAESMGISTSEAFDLMAKGAIPADTAIAAILDGMERFPGAAGAMERQALTLNGVISTFKDTTRDALVGGIAPFLPAISSALQAATPAIGEALSSLGGTFGQLFSGLAPVIQALLPVLTQLAGTVGRVLGQAFEALGPVLEAVGPPLAELGAAIGGVLISAIHALAPVLERLLPPLIKIGTTLLNAINPIIDGLAPALVPLADLIASVLGVLPTILAPLLPVLSQLAKVLGESLLRIFRSLVPVLPQLAQASISIAQSFAQILIAMLPMIPPLTELAVLFIEKIGAPLIAKLAESMAKLVAEFVPLAVAIAGILSAGLSTMVDLVRSLIDIGPALGSAWETISSTVSEKWNDIKTTVSNAVEAVVGFILGIPGRVVNLGADIANAIAGGFKTAWNAVSNAINDFIPDEIGFDTPFGFIGVNLPDNPLPRFHLSQGGIVPGFGNNDSVAAMLTPGELVVPKASVASFAETFGDLPSGARASGFHVENINYNGPLDDPAARTRGLFEDLARVRTLTGMG